LSLAKFLFITADESNQLSTHNIQQYFEFVLETIDLTRDVHFYTNTTMDTLDYSGSGLNTGSKVVFAAYGDKRRELCREVPQELKELQGFENAQLCMPGVIALQISNKELGIRNCVEMLSNQLSKFKLQTSNPIIILCDDASFATATLNNFLWVTFTRCNPANDIYGVDEFVENKHWGCNGALIIDARIKPHHAPVLEKNVDVERRIDKLFEKGGSLHSISNYRKNS
jgi:4-hydroxy-3-polyprenylbenzoate decarboxylase